MRAWRRADVELRCGFNGCRIAPGAPYLVLRGEGWPKAKIRCQVYAGEPVNQEQLSVFDNEQLRLKDRREEAIGFESAMKIGNRSIQGELDWKRRAAGDEE